MTRREVLRDAVAEAGRLEVLEVMGAAANELESALRAEIRKAG